MVAHIETKIQLRIFVIFQIFREKFSIFEINFPPKIENSINLEATKIREKIEIRKSEMMGPSGRQLLERIRSTFRGGLRS